MLTLLFLTLVPAQLPTLPSNDFPPEVQTLALQTTVRINNPAKKASGTGAVVGVEGAYLYVLTAQHVIDGAEGLEIALFTKGSYPQPAEVLKDARVVAESKGVKDLALLKVLAGDITPTPLKIAAPLADAKKKDFPALTVGCGGSKEPTCRIERVTAARLVKRPGSDETGLCWEMKKAQEPGRSGGPMLDRRGQVIGICSGNNRDQGYFCHLREIELFLARTPFSDLLGSGK